MGRPRKLTAEQIAEAVSLYAGGLSTARIASRYGVNPRTVAARLKEAGALSSAKVLTRDQIASIPYRAGSAASVADSLGVSGPNIDYHRAKAIAAKRSGTITDDERDKVATLISAGKSVRQAWIETGISPSVIRRIVKSPNNNSATE